MRPPQSQGQGVGQGQTLGYNQAQQINMGNNQPKPNVMNPS
jgi:hypothetical protein